eukprot:TRINITY_DN2640_c0_g1_i2.p1 TRINITY_DN2640_c0_g1~~TRINITY_DN2640_c0_g1_i2.p1  ORF type:complete len:122 (+),score=13.36 TRINITY_DN2640_c0_g1_i2:158-523(+)
MLHPIKPRERTLYQDEVDSMLKRLYKVKKHENRNVHDVYWNEYMDHLEKVKLKAKQSTQIKGKKETSLRKSASSLKADEPSGNMSAAFSSPKSVISNKQCSFLTDSCICLLYTSPSPRDQA